MLRMMPSYFIYLKKLLECFLHYSHTFNNDLSKFFSTNSSVITHGDKNFNLPSVSTDYYVHCTKPAEAKLNYFAMWVVHSPGGHTCSFFIFFSFSKRFIRDSKNV